MVYVCVRNVMDVFSVCIVMHGAVGGHVWELCVFYHTDVVGLCQVCILWQSSMMCPA